MSINYKDLFKQIIKVGLPIAMQGVLISLVGLIDNLFIGHLKNATDIAAGLNAINNITFNITTIVGGFMAGIGVYFAQASGKQDTNLQKKLFWSKMFWTLFWAISLIIVAIVCMRQLAQIWLPSSGNIDKSIDAAYDYGKFIFPSLIIDYFVMTYATSFKENKLTKTAMLIASSAIIVNASLNYPFMYTMGMGVKGSAIATLIAKATELTIWVAYIMYKKPTFIPHLKDIKVLRPKDLLFVLPKSFMWMINSFVISLGFTLQIMFMSRVSLDAGASLNSAGVIAQLIFAFTGGYALAINILIMYRLAEFGNEGLKKYTSKLTVISAIFGLLAGGILASLSWTVYYIYPNYNEVTKEQSMIMIISIGTTMVISLITTVYISTLKGAGYTMVLLLFDGGYSWAITLVTTVLLVNFAPGIPIGYIYWIVGASSIFKPVFMYLIFRKLLPKFKKLDIKGDKKWKKLNSQKTF